MKTFRVTTPTPGFTGEVGAISFANGEATVGEDETAALSYFEAQGYSVTETVEDPQTAADAAAVADQAARITELEAQVAELTAANAELQAAADKTTPTKTGGTKA